MRRILAALMVLLLAGSILVIAGREDRASGSTFAISAEPVELEAGNPSRDRVGRLRWLGGWALSSANADFGGISGLAIEGDGFVAISDAGGVFRFAIGEDGAITRAEIFAVPAGPAPEGGGPPQKRDRDAESLAADPATANVWIGFERANALWRYDAGFEEAESHHAPPEMEDWPVNGGPEAMVRFPDGRFLVISEEGTGPRGSREALLFASDPSQAGPPPLRLGYRPPEGFAVTDAALLSGDRLLLLNRRFTVMEGVSVIVSLAEFGELADGAIIEAQPIAVLRPPLTVDNMEALAVTRENGRTIVWMASDDNFNPLQRTLLFKFELVDR